MATSVYQKRLLERRKANGQCIDCGNMLDRDGVRCVECNMKHNEKTNADRKWYKDGGVCPRCGKNNLFGDEKACPECNALAYSYNTRRAQRLGKEYINQKQADYQKVIYKSRSEQGICTRCGKRKAMEPYKMCGICRAKDRKRKEKYAKPSRSERHKHGLCYFCDNPIKDGYKVCEKHYQMNVEKAKSEKAKEAREKLITNRILY